MRIKLAHPDCMPHVGSAEAAGMDLRAYFGDRASDLLRAIPPGESLMIDTGVSVEIPEGWVGIIVPRSSLGKRRLIIANTVGVIDSDYRGTIKMNLINMSNETQPIDNFERLCQMVIVPHYNPNDLEVVDELTDTVRGTGGFGSSGKM